MIVKTLFMPMKKAFCLLEHGGQIFINSELVKADHPQSHLHQNKD